MTDREVMQQVLVAWDDPMGMKDLCVAMDALRNVLEQQAEPVAWMYTRLKDGSSIKLVEKRAEMPEGGWSLYKEEPLYTTPPQRKELSASEILDMMPSTIPADYDGPLMEFARAVEAKLKERKT